MKALSTFRLTIIILTAVMLVVIIPTLQSTRAAGPWYVAPGGSDGNDCLGPATACATINGALNKPGFVAGDSILVATGVYTDTGTEVVLLSKDATLSGGWDVGFTTPNGTSTIDGQGTRRGMTVNKGVIAVVERFTVQNGSSDSGGGLYNTGNLTLTNSIISNNVASYRGGGIYNYDYGSILTLNNCILNDNEGGGINSSYGAATVNNSTISNNTGGGISAYDGTMTLNNSTISGNVGGGISGSGSNVLALNNCTVTGNRAEYWGGGISDYSTWIMQNTILAGNTAGAGAPDCYGYPSSAGYNIIGNTNGCGLSPAAGDLINVDPQLGPLAGSPGYHPLLLGSPAINAGNPVGCTGSTGLLTTDQRGLPRFGRCDIGAYELQPLGFSTKTINASPGIPGQLVTYTIALTNGSAGTINNIFVTDTLPITLAYHSDSLTATSGTYGFNGGIITWTGALNAQGRVTLTFGATVSQTAPLGPIVNTAIISGGGEIVDRAVTLDVDGQACNVTKYAGNPVLTVGANGMWDDAAIWRPTVLKEGSIYKMWYSASDGATRRIGYSASPDGIHWTKYGGNPVLMPGLSGAWDAAGVYAPSVIYDGSVYKMWYQGRDSSGIGRIGYATSPDGIAWTKLGNAILGVGSPGSWDDSEVTEPNVIKGGAAYHLWYVGNDGVTLRIGHATSADGISWNKDATNPVLDLGSSGSWDWLDVYSPSVLKVGDAYKLWYSGGTLPATYQTGYATSPDGSAWTRQQKLIAQGPLNTFDVYGADYPAVIVDSPGYKMWYSGINSTGTYNIGYATIGVCGLSSPPTLTNHIFLPLVRKSESCAAYYTDNFSDPNSGWPVDDNNSRRYAYIDGQYQILVKQSSQGWFATPGAKATDFTAVVNARRMSGTSGQYGILFGINEDWSQYYQFGFDGAYYSIWRYDGSWTALKDWTRSNDIAAGTAWNRLKVIRNGSSIAVYANNQLLTTVTDSNLTGLRRIGLVTYSPNNAALDARFDNFSLYPASCNVSAADAGFEMGRPEIRQSPVSPSAGQAP